MGGITMTLSGNKEVMAKLMKAERQLSNLTPIMKKAGIYMLGSTNRTFTQEGRPHWKDIKKETKRKRELRNHWPGKILQVSGRLKNSIVYKATKDNVKVGTSVPYAPFLQFGTSRGLPSRPFLQFLGSDITAIKKTIEMELQGEIKRL